MWFSKIFTKDVNPCLPNPCLNSGICNIDQQTGQYTCSCQIGFGGINCGSRNRFFEIILRLFHFEHLNLNGETSK